MRSLLLLFLLNYLCKMLSCYHYPEKLNCANCEVRKGNQHMPGKLVCAKWRRWERLKLEKMVCAKCEMRKYDRRTGLFFYEKLDIYHDIFVGGKKCNLTKTLDIFVVGKFVMVKSVTGKKLYWTKTSLVTKRQMRPHPSSPPVTTVPSLLTLRPLQLNPIHPSGQK